MVEYPLIPKICSGYSNFILFSSDLYPHAQACMYMPVCIRQNLVTILTLKGYPSFYFNKLHQNDFSAVFSFSSHLISSFPLNLLMIYNTWLGKKSITNTTVSQEIIIVKYQNISSILIMNIIFRFFIHKQQIPVHIALCLSTKGGTEGQDLPIAALLKETLK